MKTSEDLKYLGETLFEVSLPEDADRAREEFTQLFMRDSHFKIRKRG
jgi:hypothetical protein